MQSLIDYLLFDTSVLQEYMVWFHHQTDMAKGDIQVLYSRLAMVLSREVNGLYQDLRYHGEYPLHLNYQFLSEWDVLLVGTLPSKDDLLVEDLERGDYVPERERRL